jgi:hypothetical protein
MAELLHWLLTQLQSSALGDAVRNAPYLYAMLEAVHIVGIAVLVGPAFAFDLRLLGVGHRFVSVGAAARTLLPVSHVGLAIAFVTGIALLSAQATVVARTSAAPWKLGLLILAGLNVLVFHTSTTRRLAEWTSSAITPVAARIAAILSLIAWTGIIFVGRLLAYT